MPAESRLCECGCGQVTRIAKWSSTRDGAINGQPMRFVLGHNSFSRRVPVEIRKANARATRRATLATEEGRSVANRKALEWSHRNLEWKRLSRALARRKMTLDQFHSFFEAQDFQCAICGKDLEFGKQLHIDHCHDSMKVRGILCGNCNVGLGVFKDNVASLAAAIRYLQP